MHGDWELVQFKITLQNGISQYPVSSGTINISESENNKMDFISSIEYTLFSQFISENKSGTMELRDNGSYINVLILDENDAEIGTEDHRIMVLTKTDLQLEYSDADGRLRNLTFRKK